MTIYGRYEELVSRCVECDLAEPESLTSLGGSAPGVVDGILSFGETIWREICKEENDYYTRNTRVYWWEGG